MCEEAILGDDEANMYFKSINIANSETSLMIVVLKETRMWQNKSICGYIVDK